MFLSFIGWRLLPKVKKEMEKQKGFNSIEKYVLEIKATKSSLLYHKAFSFFENFLAKKDVALLVQSGKKKLIRRFDGIHQFNLNDILALEGDTQELVNISADLKLELLENNKGLKELLSSKNYKIAELIITQDSEMVGKAVEELKLDKKYDLKLLGVSRQGKSHRGRLKSFEFKVGDVLMAYLNVETIAAVCASLKCISIREREIILHRKWSLWFIFIPFSLAMMLTALDLLPFQLSLGIVLIAVIMTKIISASEGYECIRWPVIVWIGSLIPLGEALGTSGAAQTW